MLCVTSITLAIIGFNELPTVSGGSELYGVFVVFLFPMLLLMKIKIRTEPYYSSTDSSELFLDSFVDVLFFLISGGALIVLIKSLFFIGWQNSELFRMIVVSFINVFSLL